MKKNGFTLVELVGTIVIISVIAIIISPIISSSVKSGTQKINDQTKKNIILAAKNWANDHKNFLPKGKGEIKVLEIYTMQQDGYLENDIKIPEDDNGYPCILISKTNEYGAPKSTYEYEFNNDCDQYRVG